MKSNEAWRNDPVRRERCRQICQERAEAAKAAIPAMSRVVASMHQDTWLRRRDTFEMALKSLEAQAEFFSNVNETYIGNMAALGEDEDGNSIY